MKQLKRPLAPHPFNCNETKRGYYEDLYDTQGNVKARWQTIREFLFKITNGCCAFCGENKNIEVDHFFPKGKRDGKRDAAPYLAYCWENLLPCCSLCNKRKSTYFPKSLKGKQIIEVCVDGLVPHDHLYDLREIMDLSNEDRLIDPSFDQVEQHLIFDPEFMFYTPLSSIGEITNERFFEHDDFVKNLEKISNLAKALVKEQVAYEVFEAVVLCNGEEFYLRAFYEYWKQEQVLGFMR
jgi:hypothetical protein